MASNPINSRDPTYINTPWYKQFAPGTQGELAAATGPDSFPVNAAASQSNQFGQSSWYRTRVAPNLQLTAQKDFTVLSPYDTGTPILAADIDTPQQELGRAGNLGDQNHDGIPDQSQEWQAVVAAHSNPYYIGINPEIAKSYVIEPTAQGQRGAMQQRQSMMFDPRNSPSRSQFQQGYTEPIQQFAASNTWQIAAGSDSVSKPARQPSLKQVSPFTSSAPISTKMPWDL